MFYRIREGSKNGTKIHGPYPTRQKANDALGLMSFKFKTKKWSHRGRTLTAPGFGTLKIEPVRQGEEETTEEKEFRIVLKYKSGLVRKLQDHVKWLHKQRLPKTVKKTALEAYSATADMLKTGDW